MGRNDGVDARKERIQKVNQTVVAMFNNSKNTNEFPLDVTIAGIEYDIGLTQKRIMEYLTIGEKRGLFEIDREKNQIKRVSKS